MALVPWAVARVAVAVALVVDRQLVARAGLGAAARARVAEGLLGWDAGWYESIARSGYGGAGHASLRFFPLVPLMARALSELPAVSVGAGLLVVSNVSALVALTLLVTLARRETGDDALARRAAWLAALAPPAFTAVMGYAESTLLMLAVGVFLTLRSGRWWWAAGLGVLAGLTRPLGLLLAVPALVEVLRRPRGKTADAVGRLAAVVGAPAGTGAYLLYTQLRYHAGTAPLTIQTQSGHRGRLADPFATLVRDARYLVDGQHLSQGLHLPWVLLAVALVLVALWRWPLAYGAFAAAVVAVALTSANLDGFERYALSAFPLVLAGASVTSGPRVERAVVVLSAAGLVGYAVLAFANVYVP